MMEDIRKTALAHAMDLASKRMAAEASEIVKDASVFEAYLAGDDFFSVNDSDRINIRCRDKLARERLGCGIVASSKLLCDNKDQPLTGCGVTDCAHSNSSSVQDGGSVEELPTPSRTETVASENTSVMQACTHTQGAERVA